jgi:type III restriction enzyme
MRYMLKDYQEEAVQEILANLRRAAKRWHEEGDRSAFSLAAITGAGKTVIAAAVFEALFHGDDDHEFPPDPSAVVIWFSDDPALNEQTRFRLREASERLASRLDVVKSTFDHENFEAGNIYFINTQKLGRNSLLTRGHSSYHEMDAEQRESYADARSHTIWATIQNTIDDPNRTLYFVLDEAHRGMGVSSRATLDERSTIVKRLINGNGLVSPLPIVWGISATIERFRAAMQAAEGRSLLPNVVVSTARVQESGLLKDIVALDVPDEAGRFDTVLVRLGRNTLVIAKSRLCCRLWCSKCPIRPIPTRSGGLFRSSTGRGRKCPMTRSRMFLAAIASRDSADTRSHTSPLNGYRTQQRYGY